MTRKLLQSVGLGCSIPALLEIGTTLFSPGLRCFLRQNLRTPFKFVGNYLSLGLHRKSRIRCLLHHYRFVESRLTAAFPAMVLKSAVPLWQRESDGDTYAISLTVCDFDLEGELSLILTRNGQRVCVLSFAVIPGEALALGERDVLFVSRIQGARNPELIKCTTKALGDLAPPALLLTAGRGIAQAGGIGCLAGVASAAQVSVGEEPLCGKARFFDYDQFWISKGGRRVGDGFYRLEVTPHSRPAEAVTGKHRARTLRKRRFDDSLLEECRARFEATCLRPGKIMKTELQPGKVTTWVYLVGVSIFC